MRNLLILFFALIANYVTAQKIFLSSEITEKEKIDLVNKYSSDNFDQKNMTLLHARIDSAVKMVFPKTPKIGLALDFQAMVSADGKVDFVLFDLVYAQRYNKDSLVKEFKAAFASQIPKYKAIVPGKPFVRTFYMAIGAIKAPRTVRQTDSSLVNLNQLITYKDTLRIKRLFLHELELTEIPNAIYRYPNLEELYLSKNQIKEVNLDMKKLPKLAQIHLQGNEITSENFKISRNKSVYMLNLNENLLSGIPQQTSNCRRLNILWMGGNDLSQLANRDFMRLKRVMDLNFYKTNIATLPSGIKKLKRLEVLDLYYNKLEVLPSSILKLKKLTHLAVAHNQLNTLPEKLYKLKRIHTLYVHHNRLSKLPEQISSMHEMKILDLGYNWFTDFPVQITAFTKLEELDLSGNNFHEFPKQLLEIKHLNKLFLRGNPFTEERTELKYGQQLSQLQNKNIEVFY